METPTGWASGIIRASLAGAVFGGCCVAGTNWDPHLCWPGCSTAHSLVESLLRSSHAIFLACNPLS